MTYMKIIATTFTMMFFSASPVNASSGICDDLLKVFNRIDKDGNGKLTVAEFSARPFPDREYTLKHYNALEAQVIYSDKNMDGYIQASEYVNLVTKGTFYESKPKFSEITKREKLDYCQLGTNMGQKLARNNFASRDTNNDKVMSFKEYVAVIEKCTDQN